MAADRVPQPAHQLDCIRPSTRRSTSARDPLDVTGSFEFGADDLPAAFRALRYRDLGNGDAALTEFLGMMSDYRLVDGLLVPHLLIAHWKVGEEVVPYARFEVQRIAFDRPRA